MFMNYLTKEKGIEAITNYLSDERIIPIIGAGFSGGMPSKAGIVPMGAECTKMMQELLIKYSELEEK